MERDEGFIQDAMYEQDRSLRSLLIQVETMERVCRSWLKRNEDDYARQGTPIGPDTWVTTVEFSRQQLENWADTLRNVRGRL